MPQRLARWRTGGDDSSHDHGFEMLKKCCCCTRTGDLGEARCGYKRNDIANQFITQHPAPSTKIHPDREPCAASGLPWRPCAARSNSEAQE
jgi:hypothetical protein